MRDATLCHAMACNLQAAGALYSAAAARLRISSGVDETTSTYLGMNVPPSMYLMNSGLISLARTFRMRACSSMSDHSAIKKKRCGSWVSRHSTPSLHLCARLVHWVAVRVVKFLE